MSMSVCVCVCAMRFAQVRRTPQGGNNNSFINWLPIKAYHRFGHRVRHQLYMARIDLNAKLLNVRARKELTGEAIVFSPKRHTHTDTERAREGEMIIINDVDSDALWRWRTVAL